MSFSVRRGESFGLVGESGCGKSTIGRLILRLIDPTSGRIELEGRDIAALRRQGHAEFEPADADYFPGPLLQPGSAHDGGEDRHRAAAWPPTRRPRGERRKWPRRLLEKVGLRAVDLDKYPHEFSGGQRQRIGIARALCVRPSLIVADEPVSALDVSIQAQVINLLEDLQAELQPHLCVHLPRPERGGAHLQPCRGDVPGRDRRDGPDRKLQQRPPRHPYTEALLSAVPLPDPHRKISGRAAMEGDVPSPIDPPPGCPFHPRCRYAFDRCRVEKPPLVTVAEDHSAACWLNDGRGIE